MYSIKKIETKHDLNPRSSEECVRKRKKKKLKGVPGRNDAAQLQLTPTRRHPKTAVQVQIQ